MRKCIVLSLLFCLIFSLDCFAKPREVNYIMDPDGETALVEIEYFLNQLPRGRGLKNYIIEDILIKETDAGILSPLAEQPVLILKCPDVYMLQSYEEIEIIGDLQVAVHADDKQLFITVEKESTAPSQIILKGLCIKQDGEMNPSMVYYYPMYYYPMVVGGSILQDQWMKLEFILESVGTIGPFEQKIELKIGSDIAVVHGYKSKLEAAPFLYEGEIMVPLRLYECYGSTNEGVYFEPETKKVTLAGRPWLEIYPEGHNHEGYLPGPQTVWQNGRVFVPLSWFEEIFELGKITYDEETQIVTIDGGYL